MRIIVSAIAGTAILAACATSEDRQAKVDPADDPRVGAEESSICFPRTINGFSEWNDGQGVVLNKGVSDRYLVTFIGPCFAADNAMAVGLNTGFSGGGCLRRGDALYFSDSITGRPGTNVFQSGTCRIDKIYAFNRDAKAPEESSDEE